MAFTIEFFSIKIFKGLCKIYAIKYTSIHIYTYVILCIYVYIQFVVIIFKTTRNKLLIIK